MKRYVPQKIKNYKSELKEMSVRFYGKWDKDSGLWMDELSNASEEYFVNKKNIPMFKDLIKFAEKIQNGQFKPTQDKLTILQMLANSLPKNYFFVFKSFMEQLQPGMYKLDFKKWEGPHSLINSLFSTFRQAVFYYEDSSIDVKLEDLGVDKIYENAVFDMLKDNNWKIEDIKQVTDGNYGYGQIVEVGNEEWWFMTDKDADSAAKEDLQNIIDDTGVTSFTEEFWKSHIDEEKLGRDLAMDSSSERELGYNNPEDYLKYENPEGEDGDWTEEQKEKAADMADELYIERVEADPLGYLEEIYGNIDDFKNLENYVDIDELIDDAINIDGRGHFLSSYDGNEYEYDDIYYYRVN